MPDLILKISSTADLSGFTATIQAAEQVGQATASSAAAASQAAGTQQAASEKSAQAATQTAVAQEKVAQATAAIGPAATAGIEPLIAELSRIAAFSQGAGASLDGINARLETLQQNATAQAQAMALMTTSIDLGIGKLNESVAAANKPTVKPLADSAKEAKKELTEAEQAAEHLVGALKMGVGIDLGHRLIEGVAEIPAMFNEIIEEGVRFNAQMEMQAISMQGAFRTASPERFLNFDAARQAGETAMDAIRAKANELGLDFHGLAHGLTINMAGMMEGGIRDIQQQIDLITTLNQAAQAKGLQGFQASRDITDLLNGRANRTLFGAELGIRDEDVKMAREAGKLYEFLNEKLAAYKEGGQAAANSFASSEQRLKNETEQLYGEISKPVFEALKAGLTEVNDLLKNEQFKEELRGLGYDVAEVVRAGLPLLRWALEMAPVLIRVAEGVGAVGLALALLKLPALIGALGQKSLAWLRNAEAVEVETTALGRNTVATLANNRAKAGGGGGAGVAGAVAGEAEQVAGAAGSRGFLSGGTSAAFIGGSLVALEAGVTLIGLWQAHEEELMGAITARSDAESQSVLQNAKQVDQADTLEKKEKARADLKKQIADYDAKITANEQRDFTPDGAGGGVYSDPDADATMLLRQRKLLVQHQLDTFDDHAGQNQEGQRTDAAEAAKHAKAFEAYKGSSQYKLEQAELGGDQTVIDDAKYDAEVEKIKGVLIEKHHLGEQDAELEAQRLVTAKDQTKEARALATEMEHITAQVEKQRDAATIHADLLAKQVALSKELPPGTGTDLGSLADAVGALPQADEEQIARKGRLADILKQIVALTKEASAADKRDDAEKKKSDQTAKAAADAQKQHDDTLAARKLDLDILNAEAAGQKDVAATLQKKKELLADINRLMGEGLTYAEAEKVATQTQTAEKAKQDREFADAHAHDHDNDDFYKRRDGESGNDYLSRTGRIDGKAVDTDQGGGIHSTDLDGKPTGDIFANTPDSAATTLAGAKSADETLDAAPSAADTLAAAQYGTPGVQSADVAAMYSASGAGLAGAQAYGTAMGRPALMAAAGLAGLNGLGAPGADLGGNNPNVTSADTGASNAADALSNTASSADDASDSLSEGADSLKSAATSLAGSLSSLGSKLSSLGSIGDKLGALQTQIDALAASVETLLQGG